MRNGLHQAGWGLFFVLCLVPFVSCWGQITIPGALTHQFIVEPGGSYTGSIEIVGNSNERVELSITQSDYLFFSDGSSTYAEPGTVERSNAGWITLSLPANLALEPNETISIAYRIQVPDEPSLLGTYWSVVLVSPVAPAAPAGTIQQILRYGIQIVAHIGDTGERKIEVTAARIQRGDNNKILEVDVANTGERWVRLIEVWAEIYDTDGRLVSRIEAAGKRLFPGTSVRFPFDLMDLEQGQYKALVIFDNGDEFVWGAQYNLEL